MLTQRCCNSPAWHGPRCVMGAYASSSLGLQGDALTTGLIEAPADGKLLRAAHADSAKAAAVILAEEGRIDGLTPPLTGAQAVKLHDLAAIASERHGFSIERRVITDNEMRAKLAERGLPDRVAAITVGLYKASRSGEFTMGDRALSDLVQRPPIAMRACIARGHTTS